MTAPALNDFIKAYDVRGLVPDQLSPRVARELGAAFAQVVVRPEGANAIVVGHDMRPSSPELSRAFADGAAAYGVDVTLIGLCSTDGLYFASGALDLPGAMFTASHNPAQYNGIKLCRAGARPVSLETGLAEIRDLADLLGVQPTKKLGQNFVHDANTVRRIVSLALVGSEDRVIEVGPGLGSLTLGLLETGAQVVAVEIDETLANQLPDTIAERMPEAAERLDVVLSDALDVKAIPGAEPTALVANLPYNVAVPVLLHMLAMCPQWSTGVVMVQSEVADRLVAAPGSKIYGIPSAKLAWYAEATRVGNVPPTVFWPVPNVDSGLVRITRRRPPQIDGRDPHATRSQVFRVVDAAFASRRKMLRSALAGLCGGSTAASELITAAGIDPTARGEALDIADLARVAEALAQVGALGDPGQV